MTKTDLIAQVAANTEMSKKSAEMAVSFGSMLFVFHPAHLNVM